MATAIVVSPHLDDAVLSLPLVIQALRARGDRVVVLTVFSEGDAGYADRRAEDRAALAALDAEPRHLGLLDAPFRRGLERSFRALVLGPLAEDDADSAAVAGAVAAALRALGPDLVLFPLGVGDHIDHRIVHRAGAAVAGRVGFYEDRPYALVRHAVRARLRALHATVDGRPLAACEACVGELLASAEVTPHLLTYLPDRRERQASLRLLARPLVEPAERSPALALRRERFAFTEDALDAAARAIAAYRSQLPELFGTADLRALLRGDGGPPEERVYWRA